MADHNTPRVDNEDHWFVDRDESGLLGVDVVRADFARDLERELAACRAALRELVACDDLWQAAHAAGGSYHKRTDTVVEYYRRRPIAWAAARKLIGDGND